MARIGCWIEAMRLRTLPVSVAGVIAASGYAVAAGCFKPGPALLCLAFAVLAQIASNFANEYYDFKAGLDKVGRDGPRRGVTEGDIKPESMRNATFITLALAAVAGCAIWLMSSWWLLPIGIFIALGVFAYSSGPYPLSHHGLGEVAVVFFFGIIPVNLTFYVMAVGFEIDVLLASLSFGLMGANVLIVNNYRDRDDDDIVGKHTLAVIMGRKFASTLYLFNGFIAMALLLPFIMTWSKLLIIVPAIYLPCHTWLWVQLTLRRGAALNPLLGMTACLMLLTSIVLLVLQCVIFA